MEIFKDITGYEGIYQVSNLGRVKSLERKAFNGRCIRTVKEKILKAIIANGYYLVNLSKNRKTRTFQIHKLVAMEFHNHKPNGNKLVIDHINEDKLDNRAENLRLVTNRFNSSRRKGGSSKYTGVFFCNTKKTWQARIYINGKKKHLGYFKCEIEAGEAYKNFLNNLNNFL